MLPLNFGPLNRAGGERRLNVAITRARRQVVVFSSFDPEQLRAEETSSVGIKHLRAYLDLAALGTDVLPRDARSASVVDRHREEIAEALRARGLVVAHRRRAVGVPGRPVDLADPATRTTPVMAVLLDGPAWARRRTVGDRDGLPVEVLVGMLRWPAVERVWLPEWLADPAAVAGPAGRRGGRGAGRSPRPTTRPPPPVPRPPRRSSAPRSPTCRARPASAAPPRSGLPRGGGAARRS